MDTDKNMVLKSNKNQKMNLFSSNVIIVKK